DHHARAVAGADERVRRIRRAMEVVPLPQRPFLALDDEQALALDDEEPLLFRLAVIERARLARLEDVDARAELDVLLERDEEAPRAELLVDEPRELADVPDVPLSHAGSSSRTSRSAAPASRTPRSSASPPRSRDRTPPSRRAPSGAPPATSPQPSP